MSYHKNWKILNCKICGKPSKASIEAISKICSDCVMNLGEVDELEVFLQEFPNGILQIKEEDWL